MDKNMQEVVGLIPISKVAGRSGCDNSTITMKTMLISNTNSRVLDKTKHMTSLEGWGEGGNWYSSPLFIC